MFCKNCGNQMPDNALFCGVCGAKVESPQPAYAVDQAAQQPASVQPAAQPAPPPAYIPPAPTYQQPAYGQPAQPAYGQPVQKDTKPLTMGQYMGMLLLTLIPILNIVLLFIWGFGSNVNLNKKNFAKAFLIYILIFAVLVTILIFAIDAIARSILYSSYYYY